MHGINLKLCQNSIIAWNFIGVESDRITQIPNAGAGVSFTRQNKIFFNNNVVMCNTLNGIMNNDAYGARSCNITMVEMIMVENVGSGFAFNFVDTLTIDYCTASLNSVEGGTIANGTTVSIMRSKFGVDETGTIARYNEGNGLMLKDTLIGVTIGGSIENRNYFASKSDMSSVVMIPAPSSMVVMVHNFVGVNIQGDVVGNGTGASLLGDLSNVKMGFNVFSGSYEGGIFVAGAGLHIFGNLIGTDTLGIPSLGYENEYGVQITEYAENTLIGGLDSGDRNVIAGNTILGVAVAGYPGRNAYRNSIIKNSIFANGLNGNGIDLVTITDTIIFGQNENDYRDSDDGANGLLNNPVIIDAYAGFAVYYNLDVLPGTFRIDFYKSSTMSQSGYGEGETWVGYDIVTSAGVPIVRRMVHIASLEEGDIITATTTECLTGDCQTFGSTSEFSNALRLLEGSGLPITLITFIPKEWMSGVRLEWVTGSEQDNMGFCVLRSNDGVVFDSIGWVSGRGNSSMYQDYVFDDVSPDRGMVLYYRLRQVDFNGVSELLPIKSIFLHDTEKVVPVYDISSKKIGMVKLSQFPVFAIEMNLNVGIYFVGQRKVFWGK